MNLDFKPIFIVGNWKSGTTPFQFFMGRDSKIHNIFPDDESNYDGTAFWRRHKAHRLHRVYGNWLPETYYKSLNKRNIIRELNNKFDEDCEYALFKRPQFILNISFLRWLFDKNLQIIGVTRNPIACAYSYFRSNYTNNPCGHGMKIGLKPPNWIKYNNKSLMEYIAWCYQYSETLLEKYKIPRFTYEDLCDNTKNLTDDLSKELGFDLETGNPNIPNLNYVYKSGCQKMSRNLETEKDKLDIKKTEKREVPPFTDKQVDELNEYLEKYKDLKTSI